MVERLSHAEFGRGAGTTEVSSQAVIDAAARYYDCRSDAETMCNQECDEVRGPASCAWLGQRCEAGPVLSGEVPILRHRREVHYSEAFSKQLDRIIAGKGHVRSLP